MNKLATTIHNVLLLKKPNKKIAILSDVISNYIRAKGLKVYDEEEFKQSNCNIELIVCLGGDGCLLHANSLFQQHVPLIIPFNLGTLGFLTPFNIKDYKTILDNVIDGSNDNVGIRNRLICTIHRANSTELESFTILNEVLIDRGNSPYHATLLLHCNDKFLTKVESDGIIISTATGSTAYSMSAGGSCVHPSVECICVTPICPLSLSFRPLIISDSVQIKIQVTSSSSISFDGKHRQELHSGDYVIINKSEYSVTVLCKTNYYDDWFDNLNNSLQWNSRKKNSDDVYEL